MPAPSDASLTRAHAARAISQVAKAGRTIDWVERERPQWTSKPAERALIYGTLRHYFSLQSAVDAQLHQPLRNKDHDLYALMLVGAYQLFYTDTAKHAAVNETVEAVMALRKPWAKRLLNGVLRNVKLPNQSFDHPSWLQTKLELQYGQNAAAIMQANNTQAPMSLRVNTARVSREDYAKALDAAGIRYRFGAPSSSIILSQPLPSSTLPGWSMGEVAVQDTGAQFACQTLQVVNNEGDVHVLDACAAPGGKLAHLLEANPGLQACLTAIEISAVRIEQTNAILQRLGHQVEFVHADACQDEWWDGKPFTHILLDAPCSGTGTIRRHPDIKLLLESRAIAAHAAKQLEMLNNLWRMLGAGGSLLYCTCSILADENDDVIDRFLEQHKAVNVQSITLPTGQRTKFGWQLLPTDPDTDGFYYALLHKA